jgi:hypothetical protein
MFLAGVVGAAGGPNANANAATEADGGGGGGGGGGSGGGGGGDGSAGGGAEGGGEAGGAGAALAFANTMRKHGVRLKVARKNTGAKKFAFNMLQVGLQTPDSRATSHTLYRYTAPLATARSPLAR